MKKTDKKTDVEAALEEALAYTGENDNQAMNEKNNENNNSDKNIKKSIFRSLTFRTLLVGALMLSMLIPLSMVENIVRERNQYYLSVLNDIAKGWGGMQTIVGPVLVVPYVEHLTSVDTVTDNSGVSKPITRDVFNNKTMILLPEDLNIDRKKTGFNEGWEMSLPSYNNIQEPEDAHLKKGAFVE